MPNIIEARNASMFDVHKWEGRFNGLLHGKKIVGTVGLPAQDNGYKYNTVHLSVPTTIEKAAYTAISVLGGLAVGFYTFANLIH